MKLPRRKFLHLAAGAAALPAMSRIASAQAYPSRPVRIIVGFAAGGPGDTLARLMGQWLSERLRQPFVVENKPGAANNIATEAVVRAPPDGYTLLYITGDNAINATLYEKLNFNFIRDIEPVASIARSPFVLEVHPAIPVKTVSELIAYAGANPGKISMASFGTGTSSHLLGEMFKTMTGIEMVHVPYRGGAPMLIDLLRGQVDVAFDNLRGSIEHIRAGKLRGLAITTPTRSPALPDVPTLSETLPGFEASAWNGIGAPKNTPAEIIDKLNKEINGALADPKVKERIADLSGIINPGSPADFGKFIAEQTEKWGSIIRAANIKPE
jgi:tripartite-type tricarboxylate transporter receptor subunit TctC